MTVARMEAEMPAQEFTAWAAYTGYCAQQRELAERKAARGRGGRRG